MERNDRRSANGTNFKQHKCCVQRPPRPGKEAAARISAIPPPFLPFGLNRNAIQDRELGRIWNSLSPVIPMTELRLIHVPGTAHHPKTVVVVLVVRVVVVAVRRAQIVGVVVVPRAPTQHAVTFRPVPTIVPVYGTMTRATARYLPCGHGRSTRRLNSLSKPKYPALCKLLSIFRATVF